MPRNLALFNLGFRPFYLLAALFAALSLPLWVFEHLGGMPLLGSYLAGVLWHAHEMVFGFAAAVITGFLFTATRNWTGLDTPVGPRLAVLAAWWLAARVLLITGPGLLAAVVDASFLPLVALALWFPLRRSANRNQFLVVILLGFAALNVAFHLAQLGFVDWSPLVANEGALAVVVLIVTIMGGRVTPAFTANALPAARVRRYPWLDYASIAGVGFCLVAYLWNAPAGVTAALAFLAALLNAARLILWNPLATRRTPILWILHLSYAWIPIGCALLGLGALRPTGLSVFAMHAFGMGAIGGMVIGMITRTARGHTGRPLQAGPTEVIGYVSVHLAAALRVFVPLIWSDAYMAALVVSGTLWSAAFAVYVVTYFPVLMYPRADGKPG